MKESRKLYYLGQMEITTKGKKEGVVIISRMLPSAAKKLGLQEATTAQKVKDLKGKKGKARKRGHMTGKQMKAILSSQTAKKNNKTVSVPIDPRLTPEQMVSLAKKWKGVIGIVTPNGVTYGV